MMFEDLVRLMSWLGLVKPNSFVGIPGTGIGKDDLIAWVQAAQNFNRVDGAFAEFHWRADRFGAARNQFEHANGVIFLAKSRPADKNNVIEPLELNRPIDTQVRSRSFRQLLVERDIDRHCALLDGRIDPFDVAFYH